MSDATRNIEICEKNIEILQRSASACYRNYEACAVPGIQPVNRHPPRHVDVYPPWPGYSARYAEPLYRITQNPVAEKCGNGDILQTNEQAMLRIDWAVRCNLIADE